MAKPKGRWATMTSKLSTFELTHIFQRTPPPRTKRTVYIGQDLPIDFYKVKKSGKKTILPEHIYATNQVVTSKYTIITFLPRNLLEQFRRIANIFFLAIDILQFFPKFSTISPGLVILPLVAILLLTAAKDGYEDVKRHQSDSKVNNTKVQVVAGDDYVNPNVMSAKSKTFTPGVPKVLRRRKRSKEGGEPAADAQDEIQAEEAKERAGDGEMDMQHAMRVSLPPRNAAATSPTSTLPHRELSLSDDESDDRHHWEETHWEDVAVGDFIRLRSNDPVPADMVICATSEPENVAYIETKNLDGETNLKSRHAVAELAHLTSPAAIVNSRSFTISAEAPDVNMYKLNAAVVWENDEPLPIDIQTVLLRGTVLRNTNWVIGVVLYTGADSKIIMNSGNTPSKRSKVERQMNPMVLINLAVLCLMAVICGIVDSVLEKRNYPKGALWLYLDNRKGDNTSINGLVTFANAFITFQNVIPISLYISIEFVRTVQAAFIYFDPDMVYVRKGQEVADGQRTLARSWNLADDLGQIEYIFSDKTGTLTQNSMEFRQCTVGGALYKGVDSIEPRDHNTAEPKSASSSEITATSVQPETNDASVNFPRVKLSDGVLTHFHDPQIIADIKGTDRTRSAALDDFFKCLALCHTVIADKDTSEGGDGAISFKAQSPDEAALVQAAADVGYIFLGREPSSQVLVLQTPHNVKPLRYELLNLLDFTSARKRMSVIIRELDGEHRILLLCKGADNVIFERLATGEGDRFKEKTGEDLDLFASEGLRTLCLASRVVSEEELSSWDADYRQAQVQIDNRDEHIEDVSSRIEQHLNLLGATAIEDKLQDGVPETIADLKRAGIKVWVATGDKLETAVAIGYSTNLISQQSNLIIVKGGGGKSAYAQMVSAIEQFFPKSGVLDHDNVHPEDPEAAFGRIQSRRDHRLGRVNTGLSDLVGANNGERPGGFILVIDGPALIQAFEEQHSKELLLQLSTRCEAVICCRVSPLQKALIVKLIKNGLGVMTLAIGDGANDVSMIQAADVGVGISGEEGLQAVNSSDYAIGQFRFLKRLLLVHGQWTYARNANMIVNFFYKNIVGIGVLWWFQIYCGWSTTYVFEYTYLLFWNVFWSLAPVIAIGIFDRNIDSHALMALPELYRYGREQYWFGYGPFLIYMLEGVYQSAIVFFLLLYSYISTTTRSDGYDVYMYEFSTTMVIASVMVVNAFHGISTSAWTAWVWFAVTIGVILIWIYTAVYSVIPPSTFAVPVYGNDTYLFPSAFYWFGITLTFVIAILPRYIAKAFRVMYYPNDIDILRIVHKVDPHRDLDLDPLAGGRFTKDGILKPLDTIDHNGVSRVSSTRRSEEDLYPMVQRRPTRPQRDSIDRVGSRTDMSTGLPMADRGFALSTEEGGVAIRRIQTNLSERGVNTEPKRRRSRLIPSSLRRSMHRKASAPTALQALAPPHER